VSVRTGSELAILRVGYRERQSNDTGKSQIRTARPAEPVRDDHGAVHAFRQGTTTANFGAGNLAGITADSELCDIGDGIAHIDHAVPGARKRYADKQCGSGGPGQRIYGQRDGQR